MVVVLLLVAFAVTWFVWDRSNTVFVVVVRDGRPSVTQGAPPAAFLHTLREIVASAGIRSCRVKGVKAEGGVSLRASGLDEGQLQRLRNTIRLSPQGHLRAGPSPVNERNFWRALGLAWLLERLFGR